MASFSLDQQTDFYNPLFNTCESNEPGTSESRSMAVPMDNEEDDIYKESRISIMDDQEETILLSRSPKSKK